MPHLLEWIELCGEKLSKISTNFSAKVTAVVLELSISIATLQSFPGPSAIAVFSVIFVLNLIGLLIEYTWHRGMHHLHH
jgi:hypothetical protein